MQFWLLDLRKILLRLCNIINQWLLPPRGAPLCVCSLPQLLHIFLSIYTIKNYFGFLSELLLELPTIIIRSSYITG